MTVHDAPAGRRERKKAATRAALRDAALRLAARDGVENVTAERIAAEADIALRTFFNYFSSKEEAIVATLAAGAEALVAAFRARPPGEPVLGALREAVLTVMAHGDPARRDQIVALDLIRTAPSLRPQQLAVLEAQEKALADAIAARVRAGGTRGGRAAPGAIYPALCAATALAALRVVFNRWLDTATAASGTPSTAALRAAVDDAIAELAAGLDHGHPEEK